MITVRVEHIRNAGVCMRGARKWFELRGLSWSEFLSNGMPIDQVEALDDAFANRVAAAAREEQR